MSDRTAILFSCGDRSAENHLLPLLDEVRAVSPEVRTLVLGGDRCRGRCDVFVEDLVGYDAHGFFAPFLMVPRFFSLVQRVQRLLASERVGTVVLMDYYGFNIRLAERARRMGIRTVYYIPPQVWASRAGRLRRMRRCIDLVVPVFPFEPEWYRCAGIPSVYVGHPITDSLRIPAADERRDRTLVGLFPGSRAQVISWNLPVMLRIVDRWVSRGNAPRFVVFGFERHRAQYERLLAGTPKARVSVTYDREARASIGAALSVSGTVALENALDGIPAVVVYRLPEPMYRFLKTVVRVPYISLPNIILNRLSVPEFIQHDIRPDRVVDALAALNADGDARAAALRDCAEVRRMLCGGAGQTTMTVAHAVAKLLVEGVHA